MIPEPEYRELRKLYSNLSLTDQSRKTAPPKEPMSSVLSRDIHRINEMIEMQNQRIEQFRKEIAMTILPKPRLPDILQYDGNPRTFDQFEVNLLCKIRVDGRALGREEEWVLYGYNRLEQGPAQVMNEWILERLSGKRSFDWDEFLAELRENFRDKVDTPDFTTFI